jgi:hypothetical protein
VLAILLAARANAVDSAIFNIYFVSDQQIGLLYLLDKNEQDDLTEAQRRILRSLGSQ